MSPPDQALDSRVHSVTITRAYVDGRELVSFELITNGDAENAQDSAGYVVGHLLEQWACSGGSRDDAEVRIGDGDWATAATIGLPSPPTRLAQ